MNTEQFIRAYEFAKNAHEGQKRKTGEPYISHSMSVADIALQYGRSNDGHEVDDATISACLLHDVVEDTPVSLQDISEKFGTLVSLLVDGVTKEDTREATVEKIRAYSKKDRRVILIKMADRLHNLRTPVDPNKPGKALFDIDKYEMSTRVYIEIGKTLGYITLAKELEAELEKANQILMQNVK